MIRGARGWSRFTNPKCVRLGLGLGTLTVIAVATAAAADAPTISRPVEPQINEVDRWAAQVEPILTKHCLRCHGTLKKKSDLDLRAPAAMLVGGERGPAIVPGKPDESLVIQFVQPDADPHMPPGKKHLSDDEIATLTEWIRRGAHGPSELAAPAPAEPARSVQAVIEEAWSPPPGLTPTLVIDLLIEQGWQKREVTPSTLCDDRTYVRRVYLDLAGRIPTRAERDAFLSDTRSDKRLALVDELFASADYARHMRDVFDVVLMGRRQRIGRRGGDAREARRKNGWFDYLERAFASNRPWDAMVREMLVARPENEAARGAPWYLYERRNKHQAIAEAVGPGLLGMQIQCAQCHDHPLAPEIKQGHYWGLVAFFNRSKNVETPQGPAVAESAIGGFVQFADLKGESHDAVLAFFDGRTVPETRPEPDQKQTDEPDLYRIAPPAKDEKPEAAAVPKFSRREQLAELLTEDGTLVARAWVNRVWAMLLGRGLVDPVDRMDSTHPPSHPTLLAWLADDFQRNGFDGQRLIRAIVASRAYQLDSALASAERRVPEAFASASDKPLSAEVLYRSMQIACGLEGDGQAEPSDEQDDKLHRAFVKPFPDLFPEVYGATLKQALFLTNSPIVRDMLTLRPGGTTARMMAVADPRQRVDVAFMAVLGRAPDAEERNMAVAYLDERADRPQVAVEQLLWSLFTSAEFVFNH